MNRTCARGLGTSVRKTHLQAKRPLKLTWAPLIRQRWPSGECRRFYRRRESLDTLHQRLDISLLMSGLEQRRKRRWVVEWVACQEPIALPVDGERGLLVQLPQERRRCCRCASSPVTRPYSKSTAALSGFPSLRSAIRWSSATASSTSSRPAAVRAWTDSSSVGDSTSWRSIARAISSASSFRARASPRRRPCHDEQVSQVVQVLQRRYGVSAARARAMACSKSLSASSSRSIAASVTGGVSDTPRHADTIRRPRRRHRGCSARERQRRLELALAAGRSRPRCRSELPRHAGSRSPRPRAGPRVPARARR